MADKPVILSGEREVLKAFSSLAKDTEDMSEANRDVSGKLIGEVRQRTRKATGTLAEGWVASGDKESAKFSNPQTYAVPQEYGAPARNISPTQAVRGAFEANQNDTTDAYARDIERKAKRANIRTV